MSAQELAVIERHFAPLVPMFDQLLAPYKGLTAQRIIRSCLISCERNPKLLGCTPMSVVSAGTTGAVLGLEADGVSGQGFIIPFKVKGTAVAQWVTGYKGYNTIGARAGLAIDGEVVYEGDQFDYEQGTSAFVRHVRKLGRDPHARLIGAWAAAMAQGRPPVVVIMDVAEINAIRDRSPSYKFDNSSPWKDPQAYIGMAGKTPRRKLARSLPMSAFQWAAAIDTHHEELGHHAFIDPSRPDEPRIVIDGEATRVETPTPGTAFRGVDVEALRQAKFRIQGRARYVEFDNIGAYTADMLRRIEEGSPESIPAFMAQQTELLERYRADYPDEIGEIEARAAAKSPGKPAEAGVSGPDEQTDVENVSPAQAATSGEREGVSSDRPTPPDQSIPISEPGGLDECQTWFRLLFLPKLRTMTDSTDLALFLGDNEQALVRVRGKLDGADLRDLEFEIKQAWEKAQ